MKTNGTPRYLVTGGAGFIGSALSARLMELGARVVVLDNLDTGKAANLPRGAEAVLADLSDPECFDSLDVGRMDAAFHLGAQVSGELSYSQPVRDFDTNARGTLMLLEWCKRRGVKRFFFTSSRVVYEESSEPLTERSLTIPASYYGAAKLAGEAYTNLFRRVGGEPTIFRLFNVYGPRQNLENLHQGMASIYLVYLFRHQPVLVKGSLDRYRDFIYVDDVVDAFVAALENPGASIGQTYNLGTGVRTTVKELLDIMIECFGHNPESYPLQVVEGTPGDVLGSIADISKAKRELRWLPRVSVREGVRRMVEWALAMRKEYAR